MKIGIISDLHIDFKDYDFEEELGVHYINAGDIAHSSILRRGFNDKHPDVMTIMGNHDYYGSTGEKWEDAVNHKYEWVREGVVIRGATLWTDMQDQKMYENYRFLLSDSHNIKAMTRQSYDKVHEAHKEWLFSNNADVLVLHHAPSFLSTHPMYFTEKGNEFFANDLDDLIKNLTKKPKLIIHGHMHQPCEYMIGETRVICNPRGYPGETTYYYDYEPRIIEVL
jgi:Icc-related predicted phosphoesterase